MFLSNGRLRRSSSVRSLDSVVYSRKPPGLIFQLRLLTAETQSSQRREIHLITALEKGLHNCFLAIVVSVVRPLCALRLCGFIPVNPQDSPLLYDSPTKGTIAPQSKRKENHFPLTYRISQTQELNYFNEGRCNRRRGLHRLELG